ncbi:MAG TPA: hypothetical protein VGM43_19130 [Bryobacteraceae bacterium]
MKLIVPGEKALELVYVIRPSEPYSDTDPRAMEVWLQLLREKTPEEKIVMTFEMSEFAVRLSESGVRARYPNASEREMFLRSAALRLPRNLMIRAYGSDPETPFPADHVQPSSPD